MISKKQKPFGVRCDICNYQWYKGSPMTNKELKQHSCYHMTQNETVSNINKKLDKIIALLKEKNE